MSSYNIKILRKRIQDRVKIPTYFKDFIEPNMGDYYSTYKVDFNYSPVCCCPLHSEKTPSFRYYENSESFYCFGCQKGGDVISLHKYFYYALNGEEISNEQAVESLAKYYLDNDTSEYVFSTKEKSSDEAGKTSRSIESIKVIEYINNINKRVVCDCELSNQEKISLYNKIDYIRQAIDFNTKIDIKEVRGYLNI